MGDSRNVGIEEKENLDLCPNLRPINYDEER